MEQAVEPDLLQAETLIVAGQVEDSVPSTVPDSSFLEDDPAVLADPSSFLSSPLKRKAPSDSNLMVGSIVFKRNDMT